MLCGVGMALSVALARAGAPVVVIGGGVAGMHVVREVAKRGQPLILFNGERWRPYNRINLTPLLAGDIQLEQLYVRPDLPESDDFRVLSGHRITAIDRSARVVTDQFGRVWPYHKLAMCTGSRPHIPPIPGVDLRGVYTFRDLDDAGKLLTASFRARRAVVIGGGLLGLEAARGMLQRGVETWVIEQQAYLMSQQLDDEGGLLLAGKLAQMGIQIRLSEGVAAIHGAEQVEAVTLASGESIVCDTVIVCTGIRANVELAREIGLAVNRGIQVNRFMQTSDPDIYAVGECAEFGGHVYGLAGPALEQATIAASHIVAGTGSYSGSRPMMRLKVAGTDVFSVGTVEPERRRIEKITYAEPGGVYRRLVTDRGKLIGAIAIGGSPEVTQIQHAVREGRRVWPWEVREFQRSGRLWPHHQPSSVREWPGAATICNCANVKRSTLDEAIAQGCTSMERLQCKTGAGSVCGSCKPLLEELLQVKELPEPIRWSRSVAALSAVAILATIVTLLAPIVPFSDAMVASTEVPKYGAALAGSDLSIDGAQPRVPLDLLWRDGFWKQLSGFGLLGLAAGAGLISMRKRIRRLSFGSFAGWRLVHAAIGVAALVVLFAHTGFRLGHGLNSWLMATFLGLTLIGAAAGAVKAGEHKLAEVRTGSGKRMRKIPLWFHILAFWPLPLLLAAHVLSVYYY